jgi:hypothetical protein
VCRVTVKMNVFCLAVWLFASPFTPLLTSHFIKMFESNFSFLYLTSFNISTSFRGMEIKKGKNSLFAVKLKNQISSNSCNLISFSPSFLSPIASGGFRTLNLTIMSRVFYRWAIIAGILYFRSKSPNID